METIRTHGYKVLAACMVAVALAFAAVAMPAQAHAAGVSDIKKGDFIDVGKTDAEGYTGTPHWRVLYKEADGSMLLMSEYLWTGDGTDASAKLKFDPSWTTNVYQGSNAQAWCQAFEQAVLSNVDGLTIKSTTQSDDEYTAVVSAYSSYTFAESANILNNDKVFFLSVEEAMSYLPTESSRIGYLSDGTTPELWYLRSPDKDNAKRVGEFLKNGKINRVASSTACAARPAFWASFDEGTTFTATEEGGVKTWTISSESEDPTPTETAGISIVNRGNCEHYAVTELPWSQSEYQNDNVPPVYVVRAPGGNTSVRIVENNLVTSDPHKYVPAGGGYSSLEFDLDTAIDIVSCTSGGGASCMLDVGEIGEDDNPNLTFVLDDWSAEWGPLANKSLPTAEALYAKLKDYALDPAHPEQTEVTLVWVKGAGTKERVDQGVTDYLVAIVLDDSARGEVKHTWGEEPTWEWTGNDTDGYTAAKATFKCTIQPTHTKVVDATVTSETKDGKTTYTAKATFEDKEYTDTKTVGEAEEASDIKSVVIAPDSGELQPSRMSEAVFKWVITFNDGVNVNKVKDDDFKARRKPLGEDWKDSKCPAAFFTPTGPNTGELEIMAIPDNEVTERMPWRFTYKGGSEELVPIIYQAPVDKSALEQAIKDAKADKKNTPVSADGNDIPTNEKYVTSEEAQTLQDAMDAAQAVVDTEKVTQDKVDAAAKTMKEAQQAFDDAKKPGKKEQEKPTPVTTKAVLKSATAKNQNYTGKALKPAVTVKDAKGKVVPASAYTVKYTNNVNPGTATATVTAKKDSKYTGTVKATFKITAKDTPVYWLYNKNTGENLYTAALPEKNALSKKPQWQFKKIVWYAPTTGEPVYRLVNKVTNDHHWTKSKTEANTLVKRGKWKMDFGGKPAFYSGGGKTVWRLRHDARIAQQKAGTHRFATSTNEVNTLKKSKWVKESETLKATRYK